MTESKFAWNASNATVNVTPESVPDCDESVKRCVMAYCYAFNSTGIPPLAINQDARTLVAKLAFEMQYQIEFDKYKLANIHTPLVA